MKKLRILSFAVLSVAVLLPQACGLIEVEEVNEIDTTSTFQIPDITVFAEKSFTLKDFVSTDNTGGIIKVSADGEYSISYDLGEQNLGDGFTFDASGFQLNVSNSFNKSMSLSEATIPAHTPISYNEADKAAVELYFQNFASGVDIAFFQSLLSQDYKFNFDVDFSIPGFPELIKTFQKADLDGNFNFTLVPAGIPFQKFVFKKDTEIAFPTFLVFESCSNADFTLVNGNKLVANKDVNVPLGTGLAFTLKLKSLDMGNGVATNGSLALQGNVSVDGVISIDPADFTGTTEEIDLESYPLIVAAGVLTGDGPHKIVWVKEDTALGTFNVTCNYSAANVALKNATIQLSKNAIPSFDAGNTGFDINGLPDMFTGEGAQVKLKDIQVNMSIDSKLPFDFGLNANLVALTNTTVNHQYALGPLDFAANKKTTYSLGTHANGTEGDVIYKQINDLGGNDLGVLLSPVPTRIETRDFEIIFDENQWLTVEAGKNYGGKYNVDVEAPIAFTADTKVSLGIGIPDVELDLSAVGGDKIKGETKAVIKMQVINTMPFNFSVDVIPKDADGKRIEGISVSMNPQALGAGSLQNPWTNDGKNVEITIVLPSGSKIIKSIGFEMTATADGLSALNENQSITLKNVIFSLPNGITTDLKDLVKK